VRVVTHGRPACSRTAPPGAVWCWHSERETILPGGEGGAWYLSNPLEGDPFTGTVEVLAPASFVVRAAQNGPTEVVEEGEVTRTRFAIERPTALVGLYAGEAEVVTGEGFPFDVLYHADRDDPTSVARMADLGAALYPLYGELFGVLPTERAQVVLVPRNFGAGGMGLMGSPFIGHYVVGELDYLLEQGTAHELAHSWWAGVASASEQGEAAFLQEGFAEYSAWLALGELQGEQRRVSGNRMNATFYMYRRPDDADVAILAPEAYSHPAYLHVTYHKGSQVLRMLEARLGGEAFLDALRGLAARGTNGLSVAALREEIERASGEDLGAILDQWLRAAGYPVLTAGPERLDLDGAYDLRVTVRETYSDGRSADHLVELGAAGVALTSDSGAVLREVDPAWTFAREVRPAVEGDVTLDGMVDAADLIAIALRDGTYLPEERRQDGGYDSLFDLDGDRRVDEADVRRAFDASR
jgi:aminopeptidase N